MKKVIAWLLVLALTAAVSIGATLAYLTDTDEDVNVMTIGNVKIDQLEYERIDDETANEDATVQEFHDNKPLYPAITGNGFDYNNPGETYVDWEQIGKDGYTTEIWNPENINNELDKMVFVKNKGTYDAYVRTVFAFEAGNYETLDAFLAQMHLNLNETNWTWSWVESPVAIPNEENGETTTNYFIAVATYNEKLAPGALTEISLSQIALDKTATNADVEAFGDTYQILVKSQAIQADGFENATMALNEGFGIIDETDIPWETDVATKGVNMNNALHYLEGDATTTSITDKVTSITYGLTKDYASVANAYTGTLVDVEQDIPVYAYYVPNGSNYDVYLLSNDVIYAPKDSGKLFMNMTALKTINLDNFDVSRVESMQDMFRGTALTTIDTTGWDTSNVKNMARVFYQCANLKQVIGIEDWETGAATTMRGMFRQAGVTGELDLSGWDVSNVTTMAQMFYKATNLVSLNAEGWDAGAVTDMSYFITQSGNLQYFNGAGWNTSSVENMYAMFYECTGIKTMNVTGWDTSNVTDATYMFIRCRAMTEMIGSGGLNFGKVTNMASMCEGWDSMTTLDVTNWNCGSATNMTQMFAWALKLENFIGIENWDVSNVETFSGTFRFCYRLKDLNVSTWKPTSAKAFNSMFSDCTDLNLAHDALKNWDLPSVEKLNHMFYGAKNITGLDLSGWDLPNLITVTHMFADCSKLKFVDFSGWNTPSLISLDCVFNDCVSLEWVNMGDIDTHNVTEFSQLFERCPSLHTIIGIENWDTSKSGTFVEMFIDCKSLKILDLSSFDTRAAYDNYYDTNKSYSNAFRPMFSNMNSLEKLILSDKISYYGNGNVSEGNKLVFPNPAAKEGYTAMWRNVETGQLYLGKDIPELTAATYEAYYEPIATN